MLLATGVSGSKVASARPPMLSPIAVPQSPGQQRRGCQSSQLFGTKSNVVSRQKHIISSSVCSASMSPFQNNESWGRQASYHLL